MIRRTPITLSNGIRFEGLDELDLRIIMCVADPSVEGWMYQSNIVVGPIAPDGHSIDPSESTVRRRVNDLCSPAAGRRLVHPDGVSFSLSHQLLSRERRDGQYAIRINRKALGVAEVLRMSGWNEVPMPVLMRGPVRPKILEW